MIPADLWKESVGQEDKRVKTVIRKGLLNLKGICDLVLRPEHKGPKVAIFNTTMNAAVVACELQRCGAHVLHLSTVLTPIDREEIVRQVVALCGERAEFVLVATSCVEAGMDFSFEFGFREMAGLLSSQQLLGRLNRSNEYRIGTLVVFELLTKLVNPFSPFTVNHDYDNPKAVYRLLHSHGRTGCEDSDLYFRRLVGLQPIEFRRTDER
jgi:CRISPR/Cas system-associated endonuclease/helicase Cas3